MMRFIYPTLVTTSVLLSGCTQNMRDLSDSFELAMFGVGDHSITSEMVNQSPYASIYARQGDESPLALLVLAWAEPGLPEQAQALKWLSASEEMLVTQAGRITKTVNLPNSNLISVQATSPDPLKLGLHLASTPKVWTYTLSWQPGYHFGYQVQSQFNVHGIQNKMLPNGERALLYVTEEVRIAAIEQHWQNQYWLDASNGKVVASVQTPAPGITQIALSVAKPYGSQS
ncbi:YjbF family lipoprotein [Vibrio sp. TRT 21S02]|uniref:YjbF family lipoprotein n=1 Tax=Vibrio sp. TRT 21S02 TaxID=3418507 RepID=UPI003CF3610D